MEISRAAASQLKGIRLTNSGQCRDIGELQAVGVICNTQDAGVGARRDVPEYSERRSRQLQHRLDRVSLCCLLPYLGRRTGPFTNDHSGYGGSRRLAPKAAGHHGDGHNRIRGCRNHRRGHSIAAGSYSPG
jgi:hypothetical protein